MASNETKEVYPTCFSRTFQDHTELVSVRDPASLLTHSPQDGVVKTSYLTATGRLLGRSTWKGSDRLEYATFTQDRLGRLTSMTRYQDPAAGANPVTSSWHFDSLGQLLELDEPDSVPQLYTYSRWGELLETNRTVAESLKKTVQKYDALGRLIHSEQQNGGVVDPETVHDYAYDQGVNVVPQVTPTNVHGRLARATWPTGSATFSYDDLGRTNAQVFTAQGLSYVEKHTLHTDGSPSALDLFLPDTAYAREHIDYSYDSAGRGRSVKYTNGDSQDLFQASIIDPLGRVRKAQYGPATYTADYADVGRRLMTQVSVTSPLGSRKISYGGFDPVGRERSRTEIKNNSGSGPKTDWTYDALGRLSSAVQTGGIANFNQQFSYDPLGNLLKTTNTVASGTPDTTLTYSTTDRDRICSVTFGSGTGTACNVTYDELGSILSQPTPTGSRTYTYQVDGSVRTISDNQGSLATFRYDAFGEVQELDLDLGPSSTSTDGRRDRHYGGLITRRQETIGSSSPQTVFIRKIPLHDGSVATLHGPAGPWTFEYGEQRGNRFFTDQTGAFVQNVDYQPFGKPNSTDAQPGSQLYSNKQWNGGDSLSAFGISQLGARLYDPMIGRFLSRDPLLIPRTAATTNPYAFASNDPVNRSDPSGLKDCDNPIGKGGRPCVDEKDSSASKDSSGSKGSSGSTPGCQSCGIEIASGSSNQPGGYGGSSTGSGKGSPGPGNGMGQTSSPAPVDLSQAGGLQRIIASSVIGIANNNAYVALPRYAEELGKFADTVDNYRVAHQDDSIDNMGLGYVSYLVPGPAIGVTIAEELTDYFGGRSQHTSVPPSSPSSPPAPNIPYKRPSRATTAPPNLSPAGAGRNGAFREAKRQNGIPVSRQPSRVTPNLDKRGNPQPGRTYEFDQGPGKDPIRIRDDAAGHDYGPGDPQNRGPHFNDPAGNHYDY